VNHARSIVVLITLGLIWGLSMPLSKIAVSTGHRPLGLIFWQLVVLVAVLSVISLVRNVWPVLNRHTLVYFLLVALLGAIIPNSVSYMTLAHLPAGVQGIVIASVPIFSLGIALGLRIEAPTRRRIVGVICGAGAVVLLVGPQSSLPEPGQALFVLFALVAPFCYGAEGNYIAARAPRGMDAITTLLCASAIGCVIAGPLAALTGSWVDVFKPWQRAEWALLAASLCHVAAYTGYVWLVGVAGAVFASQVAYVVTVAAVFMSALILSETYSGWVWAALVLMVVGLAMVQPRTVHLAVEKR